MVRVMTHRLDPRTLAQAPELAMLVALESVLSLATRVLFAEHTTLALDDFCPETRRAEPPTLREARRLLLRIAALKAALARYERATLDVLDPCRDEDELPF